MKPAGKGSKALAELIQGIRAAWPGAAWEWDGRLGCALSTVSKAQEAEALSLLAKHLGKSFSSSTLVGAPPDLQSVCARTGGVRGSQLVFAAPLPTGGTAFCLWWPWGSGVNFSARVGATDDLTLFVRSSFSLN